MTQETILLWFGDSYTVGNELGYHYGSFDTTEYDDKILSLKWLDRERGRPDLAFPMLVSKKLELDFLLLGAGGRSQNVMYIDLIDFIKQHKNNNKKYVAMFCLPTQYHRCFYIEDDGTRLSAPDHHILMHQARFSKFETTMLLNSMYTMCITHGITPMFMSTWAKIDTFSHLSVIPEECWLVGPTTTLVEEAWNFNDPPETWRTLVKTNLAIYNEFIKPCGNHPNKSGHEKLAEMVYDKIKVSTILDRKVV